MVMVEGWAGIAHGREKAHELPPGHPILAHWI